MDTRISVKPNDIQSGKLESMTDTINIERTIIGAILQFPQFLELKCALMLTPDHFESKEHAKMFEIIQEMKADNRVIDLLTFMRELNNRKLMEFCGGVSQVSQLTSSYIREGNFEEYVLITSERLLRRRLLLVSDSIKNVALNENMDVFDCIAKANELIDGVSDFVKPNNIRTNAVIAMEAIREIEQRAETGLVGISSGIPEMDHRIKGWAKKELHLIAGRPGMGKTAFALSMFDKMVFNKGMKGAFFSLEMSDILVAHRLFAIHAKVSSSRIASGRPNADEWKRINDFSDVMAASGMHLYDDMFKLTEIVSEVKRLKSDTGIDFVMIDYLQLISTKKLGNREQEISYISRTLKNLSTELDIPVIALSQLSRAVETRGGDHRPKLSDLRESGSLEQDASTVTFCYRPSYYGFTGDAGEDLSEKAYLIIAKHRNAELRDVELMYNEKLNQEWCSSIMNDPFTENANNAIQPNLEF